VVSSLRLADTGAVHAKVLMQAGANAAPSPTRSTGNRRRRHCAKADLDALALSPGIPFHSRRSRIPDRLEDGSRAIALIYRCGIAESYLMFESGRQYAGNDNMTGCSITQFETHVARHKSYAKLQPQISQCGEKVTHLDSMHQPSVTLILSFGQR
jgi:hypothetical protein